MSGTEKLEPCPWCGENAAIDDHGPRKVFVFCANNECFVQPETGWFKSRKDAIAKWNTRAPNQPLSDGVVERVARAISRATSVDLHGGKLTDYAADDWRDFEGEARAAIAAIPSAGGVEEPTDAMSELVTDAMLQAAYRATGCPVSEHGPGPSNREFFTQIYLAMHRAAIGSTGKCAGHTSTESSGCVWHDIGRPCQTDGCKVCGSAAVPSAGGVEEMRRFALHVCGLWPHLVAGLRIYPDALANIEDAVREINGLVAEIDPSRAAALGSGQ